MSRDLDHLCLDKANNRVYIVIMKRGQKCHAGGGDTQDHSPLADSAIQGVTRYSGGVTRRCPLCGAILPAGKCPICGSALPKDERKRGDERVYCSTRCRVRAYRLRKEAGQDENGLG